MCYRQPYPIQTLELGYTAGNAGSSDMPKRGHPKPEILIHMGWVEGPTDQRQN